MDTLPEAIGRPERAPRVKAGQCIADVWDVASCVQHPMAVSDHVCGRCGHEFCRECVVFPFGLRKPPLCVACALEAGGVRHQHTGRPRLANRQVKQRLKERSDQPEPAPVPAPETTSSGDDDEAWLSGEVDAEAAGGWSKQF